MSLEIVESMKNCQIKVFRRRQKNRKPHDMERHVSQRSSERMRRRERRKKKKSGMRAI
jgi:hypothetical protein